MENINKLEILTDDEIDNMYRLDAKKANSYKSLLPGFIILILQNYSDSAKCLRQKDIICLLKSTFNCNAERKSVGRHLRALSNAGVGVHYEPGKGAWFEKSDLVFNAFL